MLRSALLDENAVVEETGEESGTLATGKTDEDENVKT